MANFLVAILAAIAIGFVNAFVKPILSLLSLPINILTLGLFSVVINGICFWLASLFIPGFAVHGLIAFLLAPVVLSFLLNNYFASNYFASKGTELLASSTDSQAKLPVQQ